MKKTIVMLMVTLVALSIVGCANKEYDPTNDICPGKQPGVAGKPPTMAEGFDDTVDMSFTTTDTNGNTVTNEIFSGTDRGVWVVFWRTDNDKSKAELEKLNSMLSIAKDHDYKIIGIVMDGEKNLKKAKEMTAELGFTNIIWNDEVATRYEGVEQFFTKEYYKENKETFASFENPPNPGDPVSTITNSRGQIQTSCTLVPVSADAIEEKWKITDANATYEELKEQERNSLGD